MRTLSLKVAIVHDYLNQMGGAEWVLKVLHQIFPDAPIFTSVYVPSSVCPSFKSADIRTSFMQRLPMIKKHARFYLALYPYAFELFDLSKYDLVLSSSSSFAKGVVTPPSTCHICYCYSPMRFVWSYHDYIEQEPISRIIKLWLPYVIHRLRRWDEITANRVDCYIAISNEVRRRINKYYRRDAAVINPPVDVSRFTTSYEDNGYFLIISRLLPYKHIDIVIEAFNRLRLPLKIIGSGRDEYRLRKMAGPTVEFLGKLNDDKMRKCLEECRAVIFPGFEDFGLVPVEAMACGKPVIAYEAGGALETVMEGITGKFFNEQTPEAIAEAVERFDPNTFDPDQIRRHAEEFDVSIFKDRMAKFVDDRYQAYKAPYILTTDKRLDILTTGKKVFQPLYDERISAYREDISSEETDSEAQAA